MREVSLAKNELRNFDEFVYLNYCCNLDLSKNKIKEYKVLKENTSNLAFMRTINLSDNQLRELSDFPQQRLCSVNLTNNKIETCGDFNGAVCKSVTKLDLTKNRLENLKGLSCMPALLELNLSENRITSLKGLCDFPCLKTLTLVGNKISEFDVVPTLPALTHLDLQGNKIASDKEIMKMSGLTAL